MQTGITRDVFKVERALWSEVSQELGTILIGRRVREIADEQVDMPVVVEVAPAPLRGGRICSRRVMFSGFGAEGEVDQAGS